jgi:hypothetical protein
LQWRTKRLLLVNTTTAINVATAQVPQWHMIMAMVNTPIYGGGGGAVATFDGPGANEIAFTKWPRSIGSLTSEYSQAVSGYGSRQSSVFEPVEPNVRSTASSDHQMGDLIAAAMMPTTSNADCSQCDPQASLLLLERRGAFKALTIITVTRSARNDWMRALNNDFAPLPTEIKATSLRRGCVFPISWISGMRFGGV